MKYTLRILGIVAIALLLFVPLSALAENAPDQPVTPSDISKSAVIETDPVDEKELLDIPDEKITEKSEDTAAPKETPAGNTETQKTQEPAGSQIEFYEEVPNKAEEQLPEQMTTEEKAEKETAVPVAEDPEKEKRDPLRKETDYATPTVMAQPANISEEDLVFVYENTETRLDEDPQALIEEIEKVDGQKVEVNQIKETAYSPEGTSYDGLGMTIRSAKNENDNEEIKAFFVDVEEWKTVRGIHVSDSIMAVLKAYGNPTKVKDDVLIYFEENNEDKPALLFQMDEDYRYVISIVIVKKLK